jgi:dienelactone hydrolase
VVAASIFTTLSATRWLESARAAIQTAPTGARLAKPRSMFNVADLSGVVLHAQTTAATPTTFSDLRPTIPTENVDRLVVGTFQSPYFLDARGAAPAFATAKQHQLPALSEMTFVAWLPKAAQPSGGYPVVIVGHGATNYHIRATALVASAFNARGIAVIGINAVMHGSGPQGTLIFTEKNGTVTEIPAGGRAFDANGDAKFDTMDMIALPTGLSDCFRQTALDQMQLVRVIRAGLDLTGDGVPDLDGNRIYYLGMSMGSEIGAMMHAVEPGLRATVLTDGGGSHQDIRRVAKTALAIGMISVRKPPLFNAGQSFDMAYPLRDQPVQIVDVPGAIALQEWNERMEWLETPADPLPFAPHLRRSPLPGVPVRPVLFQMEAVDRTAPNPCASNLIRNAGMREFTSLYRHDLALELEPGLTRDPHSIFFYPPRPALGQAIAAAGQSQIVEFLLSDGAAVPDVNSMVMPISGKILFEIPKTLPETTGY